MKIVQELLRHSRFNITADVYSHVFPSMLEEAMDKWVGHETRREASLGGRGGRKAIL
jgi:integrase